MIWQKSKMFYLVAVLLLAVQITAAEIGSIEFEQEGDYKFPEQMLLYHLQSRIGKDFDQRILNEDIKRLFATGQFQDVLADSKEMPDGKIKVTVRLKAKPRVQEIIFEGNKKYDKNDLKGAVVLDKSAPLNDLKLKDSISNLREYYHKKGYYAVVISPETRNAGGGYVNVIFKINENLRQKVASVSFAGNTVYSAGKLRGVVATQHSYWSWLFNTGLFNADELDRDKLRLREVYWDKGYLDFKVSKIETKDEGGDPEFIEMIYHLDEGKPYRIRGCTVRGNSKLPTAELLPLLQVKTGETYNHALARQDIGAIKAKYYPGGYADIICTEQRTPEFTTHEVDVLYQIDEGLAYKIRNINITGNEITKDKVIRRELPIQPGDPVDNHKIAISRSRIMGLGYFEKVKTVTVNTEEVDKKDINLKVQEKNTAHFKIGGGWSDSDSLLGMIELSESNFDLFDPMNWFRGGGQRVRLRAQYGLERSDFSLSFVEPWLFDIPLRLELQGFHHDREYQKWNVMRSGGEMSLSKRVFDDFTSVSLGQYMAAVRVYNMDDDLEDKEYFEGEEGTDFVNTSSFTIKRDTRDSLMDPKSGYLLKAMGSINYGSHTYYRVEGTASNYYSFWEDRLTLHTGVRIGTVDMLSGGSMVPIYERYFLGGGNSIRGFKYRDVAPADRDDDIYGGQSMLIANVELSHPIWDFIRGAAFVDAGNAWQDSGDFELDDINVGVGYGLRIKVPYINAPMKFDLAYPIVIDQDHIDRKLRFHFDVGFSW